VCIKSKLLLVLAVKGHFQGITSIVVEVSVTAYMKYSFANGVLDYITVGCKRYEIY